MTKQRLQDKLRECVAQAQEGNPFWIDYATQLMTWAAKALDAANAAMDERYNETRASNADKRDAERYRFLCECDAGNLHYWLHNTMGEIGADLTAAIDAAMAANK